MSGGNVLACAVCLNEGRGLHVPERRDCDDGSVQWECPTCSTVCSVYIDGGEIDLDAFKDPVERRAGDFEVFWL